MKEVATLIVLPRLSINIKSVLPFIEADICDSKA